MYSFPNLELVHCSMSGSNCCFLPCVQISQEAGKVAWYSNLFKNFLQFSVIHIVKVFNSQWSVSRCFSGTLLLSLWSSRCRQFDLWFFCLFWIQFECLEVLSSHIVEASLGESEHYFASMWDECNCVVVCTFFGIVFLWDWNGNWLFPVLWLILSFPNLLAS